MKDKFGTNVDVGDEVVYAVRDGDRAALRYSIVSETGEDFAKVRTEGGEGRLTTIRFPDRVAVITPGARQ